MSRRAQLPDGTILEFPDETPDAVMDKAVKSHIGKAQKPATYNLTGVPGVSTQIGGMLDAAQHHAMNAVHGTAQLVEHGVNAAANALLPAPQQTVGGLVSGQRPQAHGLARVRQAINETVASDDAALAKREADYQARTAGNAGSYLGAVVGEIAPWMVGIGELRAAGILPTITATGVKGAVQRGSLLAAEGGAMGAAQPVLEGDYGTQKAKQVAIGAAASPLLAAGVKAAGAGAGAVANTARRFTEAGQEAMAQSRIGQLLADAGVDPVALRRDSGVAGFPLTVAQASPTAEAVALERALRNNPHAGPEFARAAEAQNVAARNSAVGVAGDAGRMNAAKATRTANASGVRSVLDGPQSPQPAPQDLVAIYAKLNELTGSGNDVVRAAAKKHLALLQHHIDRGTLTAGALDDIRQGVGTTLRAANSGLPVASKETALYAPVSTTLTDAIDAAVPGYRNYLSTYAADSAPIRDMLAGRRFLGAIDRGSRDTGGNQVVNLAPLRSLLDKDAKSATPMSVTARKQLEALYDALQKRTVSSQTVAAPGNSSTTGDLSKALAKIKPGGQSTLATIVGAGLGHLTGLPVGQELGGLLGYISSRGMAASEAKIGAKVGAKAADSKLAADALEAHQQKRARDKGSRLLQLLLPYQQRTALPPP